MLTITTDLQRVIRTRLSNRVVAELLGDETEYALVRNGQPGHYGADREYQVSATSTRIKDRATGEEWAIPHSAFRAYRRDTLPTLIAKLDALPDRFRKNARRHPSYDRTDTPTERAIKDALAEDVRRVDRELRAEEAELLDQIMPTEVTQEALL